MKLGSHGSGRRRPDLQNRAGYNAAVTNARRNEGIRQCNQEGREVSNNTMESAKFKEACERMQQSIQRFIGSDEEMDSSLSEDDLDDSSIIQKTFKNYSSGKAPAELQVTQELLQESLTSGALVCLICIESIRRVDPVWSCGNCYCILHVTCIQKWAKDSLFHLTSMQEENRTKLDRKWCCPKCRYEYKESQTPSRYFCFCGKEEDPEPDPWVLPHSCGQTCEKELKPSCGHHCLLLCHLGPCPPCPKTVVVSCYCGRSKPVAKRCSNKFWSCYKTCSKRLPCTAEHYCKEECHGDHCPPCTEYSKYPCLCGSNIEMKPCDESTWQCDKLCSNLLQCRNHFCSIRCHSGKCGPCLKSGPRKCPCGKHAVQLPCTEEVQPCGDTCDKLLECGLHHCSQRCHNGTCSTCLQMRTMKCRCGQKTKSVPCCREFLCEIKCKFKRDCGRHNCNRKCCVGNCPPCEAPCGRTLNCGRHKCQSRCHAGPCFPCKEVDEIKCNCGVAKTVVPCGRKKTAVPPRCTASCQLRADCHHDQRQKHRCHFGSCPPCRRTCGKKLKCGHICPTKCHSAVLTKIEIKKVKEGPWDLVNAYKMELVEKPCRSCLVPISLQCLGKHVAHEFACSEVRPWSCGRSCGRKLTCGNHFCELECHETDNAPDDNMQSDKCEPCERICNKERPKDCPHLCNKRCHPDPCEPCKQLIKKRCHCQINVLYVTCAEWTAADERKRDEIMSCKNTCPKQLSCGHRCPLLCHKEPCPDRMMCKRKVTIRCPCKRLKKEIQCVSQLTTILTCDSECKEQKAKVEAEEEQKREQECLQALRQQELELEEFKKKTERKKKKHKKIKPMVQEESWFKTHRTTLILAPLAFLFVIYFLCNNLEMLK